jgi:ribosomal protein L34
MTKHTLSNKSRYSILKLSGFRARMSTYQGRNTIGNCRKIGRKCLTINRYTFSF